MIDENLDIKLIDFGVSRIASRTSTFTNDVSGTTRYLAPEYFEIEDNTDSDKPIKIGVKIDVWSMGCMISEIFSGILPWMNTVRNEISVRKKLITKAPFPIPEEVSDPDVLEILNKCLQIAPEERISSAELTVLFREKIKKLFG